MSDPLEGYRGRAVVDDLSPGERLLKRQMSDNADLIKLVRFSEGMGRWLDSDEGKGLQNLVEKDLSEAMRVWLTATDPGSEACRTAHLQARIAVEVIKKIESVLNAGPEAATLVRQSDEVANAELSNHE